MSRTDDQTAHVTEATDGRGIDARSGRAVHDERGNSVWEWQTQPGVYTRDINTVQLKALIGETLQIQDYAGTRDRVRRR